MKPAAEMVCGRKLRWQDLDPAYLHMLIRLARDEDLCGHGLKTLPAVADDVSSTLLRDDVRGSATLVAREPLVVCGGALIKMIAGEYRADVDSELVAADGAVLESGDPIAHLVGKAVDILSIERVVLNFLQMLSGVASETARYAALLQGGKTRLLDTRKTVPGYRMLQKYAVACGGGWNHRLGLFDQVMLKDNHLAATSAGKAPCTSIFKLVAAARESFPELPVEVEVDHIDQIAAALESGAHMIMLDNFDDERLRQAVSLIGDRALTEASGGITLDRIPRIRDIGPDFVSTGATVHRARWRDIGLDWRS